VPFWASVLLGVSLFVGGVVALLGRYPLRGTLLALQGVAFCWALWKEGRRHFLALVFCPFFWP